MKARSKPPQPRVRRHFAGRPDVDGSVSDGDSVEEEDETEEYEREEDENEEGGHTTGIKIENLHLPEAEKQIKQEIQEQNNSEDSGATSVEHIKQEKNQTQTGKNSRKEYFAAPRAEDILTKPGREENASSEEEGQNDEDDSGSEDGSESQSESESESDNEPRFKPVYVSKKKKEQNETAQNEKQEQRRHEETLRIIESQVRLEEMEKQSRFADSNEDEVLIIDDTDDLDPPAEYNAWKIRELKRIQRERQQLEEQEAERQELERRQNLTEEELQKEDAGKLAAQQEAKDNRSKKGGFMQKWYHKGAFYRDSTVEDDKLFNRDYSERVEDDYKDKKSLPEALQVRGGLGLKGRTKYRSLVDEDTTRPQKRQRK